MCQHAKACPTAGIEAMGGAEAAIPEQVASPLSLLLSRHIFQQGELIELAIRPSAWWIILVSGPTLLFAATVCLCGLVLSNYLPGNRRNYIELGLLVGLARVMWATVKWMSRIHILTNMRVMTLSGVFNVNVLECPLRRMARVRDVSTLAERTIFRGTLELIPMDESFPIGVWQTIRKPAEVQRRIRAAIQKSQTGGLVS